jgi:hypothetical protein
VTTSCGTWGAIKRLALAKSEKLPEQAEAKWMSWLWEKFQESRQRETGTCRKVGWKSATIEMALNFL